MRWVGSAVHDWNARGRGGPMRAAGNWTAAQCSPAGRDEIWVWMDNLPRHVSSVNSDATECNPARRVYILFKLLPPRCMLSHARAGYPPQPPTSQNWGADSTVASSILLADQVRDAFNSLISETERRRAKRRKLAMNRREPSRTARA